MKEISDKNEKTQKKNFKANRKVVLKIIQEWGETYAKINYIHPWANPKSILSIAGEGYSYGSKRGQIRKLSDHNHIENVYDYGVDTYDFNMDDVRYLSHFGKENAESKTLKFFE